ncbi:MAG: CPBP family intramembrane glutamic endopeptidase [Cephaloticoccus sp.]
MSPAVLTAVAIELGLLLAGCVLFWRHVLSATARTAARERASAMPAWDLKVTDFFLFVFCILAGGVLGQGLAVSFLPPSEASVALSIVVHGGSFHLGMLAGVLGFGGFMRQRWAAILPAQPAGALLGRGAATFLIALPVLGGIGFGWQVLMQALGVELVPQDLVGIFAGTKSPLLLGSMIALAVVVAPVTEELIFRAGLFRYLRTRLPRWVALLLPSLLFASLHGNLASFAPLAALGLIFSLAYERTGSIAVPIIGHALFNLNTIALILAGVNV